VSSKEAKLYRRYIAEGADGLSLDEVRTVLRFQDAEPEATHRIRQEHETAKRQADARETFVASYMAQGGGLDEAAKAWEELSAEERKRRAAEADEAAREASWRATVRGF
jgi:hypothetical protein